MPYLSVFCDSEYSFPPSIELGLVSRKKKKKKKKVVKYPGGKRKKGQYKSKASIARLPFVCPAIDIVVCKALSSRSQKVSEVYRSLQCMEFTKFANCRSRFSIYHLIL